MILEEDKTMTNFSASLMAERTEIHVNMRAISFYFLLHLKLCWTNMNSLNLIIPLKIWKQTIVVPVCGVALKLSSVASSLVMLHDESSPIEFSLWLLFDLSLGYDFGMPVHNFQKNNSLHTGNILWIVMSLSCEWLECNEHIFDNGRLTRISLAEFYPETLALIPSP